MDNWVNDFLKRTITKVKFENENLSGKIPYIPYDGRYGDAVEERGIDWWPNGFWSGILWQLFQYTNNEDFFNSAIIPERLLDRALMNFDDIHHDVGFLWLLTSVAHNKLTGDQRSYKTALHAANLLAGRFNPNGNFLVSWNDHPGWVIIDSMMNIQLLFWASEQTKDPRFAQIAVRHADTVAESLIREDGSAGHIASFDPYDGHLIERLPGQGVSADSSWSRGNAWAIYGFALTYKHTKKNKYLTLANQIADNFMTNVMRTDNIPLIDFQAVQLPRIHDTSAGMIAACGLLELADWQPAERDRLIIEASNMIRAITTRYADWDLEEDGIIGGGTEAFHRPATYEVPIIYADYFFIEALLRLMGKNLSIW